MANIKDSTVIRVKVKGADGWYTAAVFFNWENALDYYNDAPTPRMLTTKAKIHHKQYSDNGFKYNVADPR
jgi:hypothetical protein